MNIKNISNLLKAYFIENWKTDLFQFGILAAIVLLFTIMNGTVSTLNFPIFAASIFLLVYPARLFGNLHNNSRRIHYISIPASNSEKVVTNIVLANVYYVLGLVVACSLGLALAHLYLTMRGFAGVHLQTFFNGTMAMVLFAQLSMFFFGSIYFRRKTFLATLGVSLLIGTIFSTLVSLTLFVNGMLLIPKDASFNDYIWSFSSDSMSENSTMIFINVIMGLEMVFFYGLSFLRMKETEA